MKAITLPEPFHCACGAQGTWRKAIWGRSGPSGGRVVWPGCPYGHGPVGPAVPAEEFILATWPQRQVARVVGVDPTTVYRWVHGLTPLNERIRARIRAALDRL